MSSQGKGPDSRTGEISPEDREAFHRRASDLGRRLDEAKARKEPPAERRARGDSYGQAMKIAVELVVGVAVGGFIGWTLDGQLGTRPWLLVLFVVLGFAAGLTNIVRTARRMQAEAEPLQKAAKPAPADDDDSWGN